MTIFYIDDNNKLKREDADQIDFKQGCVEFNGKEINTEDLVRIEE